MAAQIRVARVGPVWAGLRFLLEGWALAVRVLLSPVESVASASWRLVVAVPVRCSPVVWMEPVGGQLVLVLGCLPLPATQPPVPVRSETSRDERVSSPSDEQ